MSAGGSAARAVATKRGALTDVGGEQLGQFAAQDEHHQQHAADDGHAQEHLEGRLRHELDHRDLPVRGRDQRPALQHRSDVDARPASRLRFIARFAAAPPMAALVRPARRGYAADNRARDASTPDVASPGLVPHGLRRSSGWRAGRTSTARSGGPTTRAAGSSPTACGRSSRGLATALDRAAARPRQRPRPHAPRLERPGGGARTVRRARLAGRRAGVRHGLRQRRRPRWPGPGARRNFPGARLTGPAALLVAPGASGLRLVLVRPVARRRRRVARTSAPLSRKSPLPTSRSPQGLGAEALTWTGAAVTVALRPGTKAEARSARPTRSS